MIIASADCLLCSRNGTGHFNNNGHDGHPQAHTVLGDCTGPFLCVSSFNLQPAL